MKRKFANKIVALAITVLTISTIIPIETKANAATVDGWNNEGSDWYYYENGSKKSGWFNFNGNWYVADDDGTMKKGWYCTNGEWYFLGDDGSMKNGWINYGGKWYYLQNNGSMKTGWIEYNGKWYYLLDSGVMALNTTVNGYRFDANGWWMRDVKADQQSSEIIKAKEVIKKADINYISNTTGGYSLVYDKVSDEISKEFGINEDTYTFAFQNEDQVDKYYYIGKTSGKVYKTGSNGLFAAYLIKDGKIVERFKGPNYLEKSEKDFLKYLGNGEFK